MEKFPGGTYVPAGTLTCGEVLRFHGKDDDKTKRRKSVRLEATELDINEAEERKFERKERRQSLTRFHPDFPKISQESLEEERRLERKERRASARYEVDVMKKVQENEEEERKLDRKERRASTRLNPDVIILEKERREEEDRKLERKERRASARLNPDVVMEENERRAEEERKLERKERRASARLNPDVVMEENVRREEEEDRKLERKERRASARYEIETLKKIQENEEEERKLERKERRASARLNPDIIKMQEDGRSEEEKKFERKERRQSATRFHPDIQKINQENEKRNGQDGDLKKKWKNNREEVMKNLQIFMQGIDDTENEHQDDLRDDMSQSEADSIPPAQTKKKTVLSNGKVIDPSVRIKRELEASGTGSDFTGGKNVGHSRERLALEREKERERMAQEKEKQKVMLEKERERVMIQERTRQRAMHDKEKERIKIGQERERERALQERERLMQEREKVLQDKEKVLLSSNEQTSTLRVSPKDLKIDTGYHSTSSYNGGSDRERGYGSGKMGGMDAYGRPRPVMVPSASPSPSQNQNRRVQGSFSDSISGMGPNRTPRGSFLESGGGAGGFYGALPVTSPIVLVDGPFFLSADAPTSSYATHRPMNGSFMAGSLRSTPNSQSDRSRQSFASNNSSRKPSFNASFSNIYEKEAARRQNTSRLDEDRAVDLNLSYDNIYSRDHDDSSSDSETRSGENFNSPRNRPDLANKKVTKQEVKKEIFVGSKKSEKSEKRERGDMSKSFRHEDEFFTEGIVAKNVRDSSDSSSVSTVSHSKYGENASESDVTSFSAPNYKFPPKKYDFKKK